MQEHIDYLLVRFGNRALADPIDRLARDPLRKLAPTDRLVGAARLVERQGMIPRGLVWGIAGALAYRDARDEHALALEARLADAGLARVLADVAGIRIDEPLGKSVSEMYDMLVRGRAGG